MKEKIVTKLADIEWSTPNDLGEISHAVIHTETPSRPSFLCFSVRKWFKYFRKLFRHEGDLIGYSSFEMDDDGWMRGKFDTAITMKSGDTYIVTVEYKPLDIGTVIKEIKKPNHE